MNSLEPMHLNEVEKLGFRLEGFKNWSVEKALLTLAQIGYRSVELCLEHPELDPHHITAAKISQVKQLLSDCNLRLSAVSHHSKGEALLTAHKAQLLGLELAPQLGTGILVVGTPSALTDPQGCATFKAIEELLKAAEALGITVALEPEPDTVVNGMYEFSLLASHMAGAPLALNLDIGHAALTEGNVCEVIQEWHPFIVHTHFEDIRKPAHQHLLPGDGHLDLRGCAATLRETGYTGDLTVDLYDILDEPDAWAAKAMNRCQKIFS